MVPVDSAAAKTQWIRSKGCAWMWSRYGVSIEATKDEIEPCTVKLLLGRVWWQQAKSGNPSPALGETYA